MVDCAMFRRKMTQTTGEESSAIITFENEAAAYTALSMDGVIHAGLCAPGLPLRVRPAWRLRKMPY